MKEYRLVGKYGQWGEIDDLKYVQKDLAYCTAEYAERIAAGEEEFHIEERDVTEWRNLEEEDPGTEDTEDQRQEEAPQATQAG